MIPVSCSTDDNIQPEVEWGINWSRKHKMTLDLDKTEATLFKLSSNAPVPTVFFP